jgi:hypothetical protein
MTIHARSPVADVEAFCREQGIPLQPSVGGPSYAQDRHFSAYAFNEIATVADALALADALDADAEPGRTCTKARVIRQHLDEPFWSENTGRIRHLLAWQRRVCCGCHETGSYARR